MPTSSFATQPSRTTSAFTGTSSGTVLQRTSSTGSPRRNPASMNSSRCLGSGALAEYAVFGCEQVRPAVLVHLPVHEGRRAVDDLHPVHPDVARTRLRVLRNHGRKR